MFVQVQACVAEQKDALLVPVGAVVSIQGKTMLISVGKSGAVSLVPVTTGIQQGGMIAVQGGISRGARIVVSGTQQALMAANGRAKLRVTEK